MKQNTLFVFLLLILLIGLVGCIDDDNSLIIGEWNQIDSDVSMVFQNNGILNLISNSTLKIVNYELMDKNNIKIYWDDLLEYWEYEFINDNTLHLRIKGNLRWEILERVNK